MDFCKPRQSKEYRILRAILKEKGYYEDGMELTEMRELITVLQSSANDSGASCSQTDSNSQQPLTESGFASGPPQSKPILPSPMMSPKRNIPQSISTDTLPEPSEDIRVQAVVHHELDWSPPETDSLSRKRLAAASSEPDIPSTIPRIELTVYSSTSLEMETCKEQLQSGSSRYSYLNIPYKNLGDIDYSNNTSLDVDSLESSTEASISNLLEIPSLLSEQAEDSLSEKRSTDPRIEQIASDSLDVETFNEQLQPDSSRSSYLTVPYNKLEGSESNNTSQDNDSTENSKETSNNVHATRSPVSEHKMHDYDSIEGCETAQPTSSFVDNTAKDLISSLDNAAETVENKNEPNQDSRNYL